MNGDNKPLNNRKIIKSYRWLNNLVNDQAPLSIVKSLNYNPNCDYFLRGARTVNIDDTLIFLVPRRLEYRDSFTVTITIPFGVVTRFYQYNGDNENFLALDDVVITNDNKVVGKIIEFSEKSESPLGGVFYKIVDNKGCIHQVHHSQCKLFSSSKNKNSCFKINRNTNLGHNQEKVNKELNTNKNSVKTNNSSTTKYNKSDTVNTINCSNETDPNDGFYSPRNLKDSTQIIQVQDLFFNALPNGINSDNGLNCDFIKGLNYFFYTEESTPQCFSVNDMSEDEKEIRSLISNEEKKNQFIESLYKNVKNNLYEARAFVNKERIKNKLRIINLCLNFYRKSKCKDQNIPNELLSLIYKYCSKDMQGPIPINPNKIVKIPFNKVFLRKTSKLWDRSRVSDSVLSFIEDQQTIRFFDLKVNKFLKEEIKLNKKCMSLSYKNGSFICNYPLPINFYSYTKIKKESIEEQESDNSFTDESKNILFLTRKLNKDEVTLKNNDSKKINSYLNNSNYKQVDRRNGKILCNSHTMALTNDEIMSYDRKYINVWDLHKCTFKNNFDYKFNKAG